MKVKDMARNRERNDQLRLERQEKIFAGALRLFAKRGLGATKISDIAREVGTPFYLYSHATLRQGQVSLA